MFVDAMDQAGIEAYIANGRRPGQVVDVKDLPPDILENVIAFEKTEKLNPPMEKRAKAIPIAEVESETKKIKNEADGRGIIMNDENISDNLDGVPLYKKE